MLVLYTTYKVLYYSDYKLEKIILIIISFSVNNKNRKKIYFDYKNCNIYYLNINFKINNKYLVK